MLSSISFFFCFVYLRSSFVHNVICMPVLFFILYMYFDLAEADIIMVNKLFTIVLPESARGVSLFLNACLLSCIGIVYAHQPAGRCCPL